MLSLFQIPDRVSVHGARAYKRSYALRKKSDQHVRTSDSLETFNM